jgi:hypothetical protein
VRKEGGYEEGCKGGCFGRHNGKGFVIRVPETRRFTEEMSQK